MEDENERIDKAHLRLRKRFEETSPETKDEIMLSQALEIKNRIKDILTDIGNEKHGRNKLTKNQITAMNKRLAVISEEMTLIYQHNPNGLSNADMLLITNLMKEIQEIVKVENHEANQEEIAYLQEQLMSVILELKDFFQNNQTPDVFLIFADNLLNERMGKFFFIEDVNTKLGIYDTEYINILNAIIVPFIACSLGYPCGPESYLSIEHCINTAGFEPLACGNSIEEYYLEDLIGPNQMMDFNNYFEYIMDIHAQL